MLEQVWGKCLNLYFDSAIKAESALRDRSKTLHTDHSGQSLSRTLRRVAIALSFTGSDAGSTRERGR